MRQEYPSAESSALQHAFANCMASKMSQSIDHVRGAVRSVCQHRLVASTVHIAQEMPVSRSRKWDADNTWIIVLLTELVARFCQVP